MLDQKILVKLRSLRQKRGAEGHPEATAKITEQIEDSGRIAHLLPGDIRIGGRRQRHEKEAHAKSLHNAGPGNSHEIGLEVESRHQPQRVGHQAQADSQQQPRLDPLFHEYAGHRHDH